jgi:ferrous iron transport protein A
MNIRLRRRKRPGDFLLEKADGLIPLSCLCEGQIGEIVQLCGGCGMIQRLAEMGLTPGVKIKVMRKCAFSGPVEVEVRGTNLALGRGVAARILVKPLQNE